MNLEDFIKDLAPELQEKARACSSAEELIAFAKEAKIPLPGEVLQAIAGGERVGDADHPCPQCGSTNTGIVAFPSFEYWRCYSCGCQWDFQYLD